MSRYMYLVDNSLSFDDLSKLEIGDTFYESVYGTVIESTVIEQPRLEKNGDMNQVLFVAKVRIFDPEQNSFISDEEEDDIVEYCTTENMMHYGPKCYKSFYVWDRQDQKAIHGSGS